MNRNMLRSISLFAFAAAALSASANLVSNSGFETGDFTGWAVTGNTVVVFVGYPGDPYGTVPHTGDHLAALGANGSPNSLSQSIATMAGQSYTVSFWARQLYGSTDPSSYLDVSFGGTSLASFGFLGTTYQQFSYVVTAGAGTSSLLDFTHQNNPDGYLLDDISVTANVPGPAAAVPFALMALRRRKRA